MVLNLVQPEARHPRQAFSRLPSSALRLVYRSDVINDVGKDIIRFIMLTRRNDMTLDFDFAKVKEQSKDNPVFYVQYAHARCCSVLRKAEEVFGKIEPTIPDLSNTKLLELVIKLCCYQQIIETAVKNYEPHLLIFYIIEVASQFHSIWNSGFKFVDSDKQKTEQNLAIIFAVKTVISSVLNVCNIAAMDKM